MSEQLDNSHSLVMDVRVSVVAVGAIRLGFSNSIVLILSILYFSISRRNMILFLVMARQGHTCAIGQKGLSKLMAVSMFRK